MRVSSAWPLSLPKLSLPQILSCVDRVYLSWKFSTLYSSPWWFHCLCIRENPRGSFLALAGIPASRNTEKAKGNKPTSALLRMQRALLSWLLRMSCTTVVIWCCFSRRTDLRVILINSAVSSKCYGVSPRKSTFDLWMSGNREWLTESFKIYF